MLLSKWRFVWTMIVSVSAAVVGGAIAGWVAYIFVTGRAW